MKQTTYKRREEFFKAENKNDPFVYQGGHACNFYSYQ